MAKDTFTAQEVKEQNALYAAMLYHNVVNRQARADKAEDELNDFMKSNPVDLNKYMELTDDALDI